MSSESCVSPQRAKTRSICSSDWTSHGSTKVDPIDSARGRTRFSIRLSTDEKPTSAPSAWSASAMPQAIEWSLATPKMSAVLPSSSPIRSSARCRRRAAYHRRMAPDPTAAAALQGVRGLVLDADGVIVLKGEPLPGSVDAIRSLQDRGIPFRVVTNFSQMHRETLARWMGKSGLAHRPGPDHHGDLGHGRPHRGGPSRPAAAGARRRGRAPRVRRPAARDARMRPMRCRPARLPPSCSAMPATTCRTGTWTSPSGWSRAERTSWRCTATRGGSPRPG